MSLPRGFVAVGTGADQSYPAMLAATFVRDPPGGALTLHNTYPKYTYYLGPFETYLRAVEADAWLWHWSRKNGWDYSSTLYTLFPEYQAGAFPHRDERWHVEGEYAPAETYVRVWNPNAGRYEFKKY